MNRGSTEKWAQKGHGSGAVPRVEKYRGISKSPASAGLFRQAEDGMAAQKRAAMPSFLLIFCNRSLLLA